MAPTTDTAALARQITRLQAAGVRLVPVHEDKSPMKGRWNRRRTRVPSCLQLLQEGGAKRTIPAYALHLCRRQILAHRIAG